MSTPINDGGPAYPQHMAFNANGEAVTPGMYFAEGPGMTLRDWFAGQALAGFMAQPDGEFAYRWKNTETGETRMLAYGSNPVGLNWVITKTADEAMAECMYRKADAMLAERSKGGAA